MPDNSNVYMPYNLDAEQSVLGSVLLDASCMSIAIGILKDEHFYLPEHQQIYSSMRRLYTEKNGAIDTVTVADDLEKSGYTGQGGARQYIWELSQVVPSTVNVEKYCEIVKEQYQLRELISLSQNISENATSGSANAKDILEIAEQRLFEMRQGNESRGPKLLKDVIVNGVYDRLEKLNGENADEYKGIPTGFGMLDSYIMGLNRSDLILIGARPAMGKTSFALNLAHNLAVGANKKVVFFSLEMTNEQLAERLLASQSGIEAKKFRSGELTEDEWIRLGNAVSVFYKTELWLEDSSNITVPEMKSIVRRMRGVDCVIVDYLGLISSAERTENRVQEVTKITKNLKMMAKDLNIPVVVCAQLSRGTEGRGKSSHRPQLSDLRESGSIEQDADIVMFLYREVHYANELDDEAQLEVDKNKTELIVAKNRHGGVGTVDLIFDSEFTRFRAVDNVNDYN
ncbi:MAG: replicative DNA helicase [Eubacterium sp.]|nr:replicative DNA helicase [Eubacterium sp.]